MSRQAVRVFRYDEAVAHGITRGRVRGAVIDLARAGRFRAGVVAADGALRLRRCTGDELRAVVADCAGWPGVRTGRQVAGFADARAANPLESISRAAFHEWGLPRPQLQVQVRSLDMVDFLWEAYGVVGEADGMGKYAARRGCGWRSCARSGSNATGSRSSGGPGTSRTAAPTHSPSAPARCSPAVAGGYR